MSLLLQSVGIALLVLALNHIRKVLSRGKYHATSRISWKGFMFNLALWPESILKRKPAFQKLTLAALKKSAVKGAKGLDDFGFLNCVVVLSFCEKVLKEFVFLFLFLGTPGLKKHILKLVI